MGNEKMTDKKNKKKIKSPKDGSAPEELFTNPDKVFDGLLAVSYTHLTLPTTSSV